MFISQDTVVGLQALALFAERVYGRGLDVTVNIESMAGETVDFLVTRDNRLLLQQHVIKHPDSQLQVTVKGEGCIMLQVYKEDLVMHVVWARALCLLSNSILSNSIWAALWTPKLISAFVFATRIVQSLYFLNLKFQASSHLQWLYSLVCVRPGQIPNCWFSHVAAHLKCTDFTKTFKSHSSESKTKVLSIQFNW